MILDNFFEPRKKSIVEDLDQPTQLAPGLNQTIDSKTGLTTRKYSMGPTNVKQITDPKGKILSTDAEVDYGIGKFAFGQAGGITSKAYTPAPGQEGMSGRDLYSMGNANKAATYDRAAAAVNEAPMSPASPALAAPKAPGAPAAPAIPAAFSATTNGQYNQVRDKSKVNGVWRNNPQAANPMSQDPAQRITGYQAAEKQAAQPGNVPGTDDFDSWEQNGDTAVPVTKGGVRQNLYKTPVNQVPRGASITQKYNTYQQQGDSAYPVDPNGGIQQLAKIPVGQVPKGANITQAPTPDGNLYKNLPAAPALEEDDQPIDKELVNQIYNTNRDIIGPNMNLIEPKTMINLPDGTPYEIQPGDSLSKIARNIPAIKASMASAALPIDPQAAAPTWMDKLKKAGTGLLAGEFPSQAIPAAFPSLKKPAAPDATANGTVVNPDWSQTKYNNLGPLVKGSDGVWRTQDGKISAVDPEIIAMAEKLARSNPAPAPVARALPAPIPIVNAPPEMVAPADSMDPGEEIVVKSKVKPHLPPRTPSPQPFMPAGANPERPKEPHVPTPKEPTIIDKAGDKIGQAYHWLADLVKGRESGNDYDRGYHYPPGSGDAGPNNRKTTAWGAYGLTQAYIDNARKLDPTLDKPLKQWTAADQDHAFQLGTSSNVKRMSTLGVDVTKHPEAPSIAHALGPDGAAEWYKSGTLRPDAIAQNGGEEKLRAIIAQRTKDAQAALELQNKEKAKQKTKESAVSETIQTVKVMLETATTRDDVRRIKDYIDRQYTRHGLTDSVSFAQRNHLVERVIEITAKRRILT